MSKTTIIFIWRLPFVTSSHVPEEFGFQGGFKLWIKTYKPNKPKSNFYYFIANASIILGAFIIAFKAKR